METWTWTWIVTESSSDLFVCLFVCLVVVYKVDFFCGLLSHNLHHMLIRIWYDESFTLHSCLCTLICIWYDGIRLFLHPSSLSSCRVNPSQSLTVSSIERIFVTSLLSSTTRIVCIRYDNWIFLPDRYHFNYTFVSLILIFISHILLYLFFSFRTGSIICIDTMKPTANLFRSSIIKW